jgi:heavy metal translocating P-type ATPase
MKNPSEKLMEELAEEQKELRVNVLLTGITFVGLVTGVFLQFTQGAGWSIAAAFIVAYLAGGLPAAKGAVENLLQKSLDIDLLMVLAALAAAGVGEARDGAILLFLFSLASTLEGYAMGNTKRAVAALMNLRPDEANLEAADGTLTRVKVEELTIGQTVLVKAGERIPIDGEITRGASAIDQSAVTGESVPVDKNVGDLVFTGSVNGYGVLAVTVQKLANQSTLARMIDLVASAQAERSPSERFSEWFGSRYTVVVLVGSIVALAAFILFGIPLDEALYKAATLLVVASPCAIVISVPAAVLSALAAAANRGMLFKGGAALEEFGAVTIVAFDKTGTLTEGKMRVASVVALNGNETELLQIAASLEAHSEHPLAHSILQYAKEKNILPQGVEDTAAVPGKGLRALIGNETYWAGNRKMLIDSGITCDAVGAEALATLEAEGKTTIIVGNKTTVLGFIGIADTVRESAREAIALLRSNGIKRVVMLTGDHESVATSVAAQLGINPEDIYAGLLPEDKVEIIKTLKETGNVSFVGDGVNDAAALVTSNVGIAMGTSGTDVALEAADVALITDDLRKITGALRLSKQADTIIKQNLVFAIGILSVMVVVTIFFYLPLPLGVIGHEGGTLIVVANGLRLLFWNKADG